MNLSIFSRSRISLAAASAVSSSASSTRRSLNSPQTHSTCFVSSSSFSAYEEKLVTVRLRILSDDGLKRTSNKEFAYLKATQINIRITMLLRYEEDEQDSSNRERYSALESSAPLAEKLDRATHEEPRRSPSPTEDELNTLSSRAYLHNQATAFE